MVRLTTKLQLVAFFVIMVVGVAYVGLNYIDYNPLKPAFTIHLTLPAAGGIFTNADVTERGVVIGKVGALNIAPGGSGVEVDLLIKHGEKIPQGSASDPTTAQVSNLSAVGEQYVEIEAQTSSGPYLHSGSQIAPAPQPIPVDDAVILKNLESLLGSVNVHQLSTVVSELGKGFNNLGPSLQSLIDNGNALTNAAVNALPQTEQLINDGRTVLDTQNDIAGELKQFASTFSDVSDTIAGQDTSLRTILDNGTAASVQLKTLIQDNQGVVPTLLSNLNTFTGIQDVRIPYTRAVLELYPAIVADSFYALPKPGSNGISTARFGLVNDTTNTGCGSGYSSTKQRGNTAKDWGGAANLDAYCHGNNAALDQTGVDVRGSRYDPRPAGDHSNVTNSDPYPGPHYGQSFPGSGKVGSCGTTSCVQKGAATSAAHAVTPSDPSSSPTAVIAAPYDPSTGVIEGLDGKLYELGLNGPLAPVFGSSSYTWLLIAPTMR
jgi:phospholipid/cholesterol/gamma-HCH transport system substrate-binding protein